MGIVSASQHFADQAVALSGLPKPPGRFYHKVDRPSTDQQKVLRGLGMFSIMDYVRTTGINRRTAYDHIVRLLAEGIIEPAGFEVRRGAGVSSRPMQVFRLKRRD